MSGNIAFQCLLGLQCKDFAILAADQTNTMSIIIMRNDEEKLHDISNNQVLGIIGDNGDNVQFWQFVSKNCKLYQIKNGYELSTAAIANFIRNNLLDALRNSNPLIVNMLLGGYDSENNGSGELYMLDFLGSGLRVPFGVHGFGGLISMSILERYYKPNLTECQAYEIIKMAVKEVHARLFVSLPKFQVKLINKHGIQNMPVISHESFMQVA